MTVAVLLCLALALPAPALAAPAAMPNDAVNEIHFAIKGAGSNLTSNASLSTDLLDDARTRFDGDLAATAASPASAEIIAEWRLAWKSASDAVAVSDPLSFAYASQVMQKLDYALAWAQAWHHLNVTGNVTAAAAWFEVVSHTFGWTSADNDAAAAMENITLHPAERAQRKAVVYNVTVQKFVDKVLEEVFEVVTSLPDQRAIALEKAGEGLGYFYGLKFTFEERLGGAKAAAAEGALRASVAAAWRGNREGAADARDAVDLALAELLGQTDLKGELLRLSSLAGIIAQEYKAAVENGAIVDPVEYEETLAFFEEFEGRWARAAPQVRALPGGSLEADELDALLPKLAENITAKADEAVVESLVAGIWLELSQASALVPDDPAARPPAASGNPAPWLVLGAVIGLIIGSFVSALAFFAYARRLLSRRAGTARAPVHGDGELK